MIAASRYSLASDVPDVHTFLTQAEIERPAAARRRLAQGRAAPARRREQWPLGPRQHARRRVERDADRVRRPAALRAVPPAAAAEPDQRARPAGAARPRRACRRIHRGVRRPHELGDRGAFAATRGRRLLRAGAEPVPRQRAGLAALRRGPGAVAGRRPPQQPRRGRGPRRLGDRRAELQRTASRGSTTRSRTRRAAACTCCCPATAWRRRTPPRRSSPRPATAIRTGGPRSSTTSRRRRSARAIVSYTDVATRPRGRGRRPGQHRRHGGRRAALRRVRPEARRAATAAIAGCTGSGWSCARSRPTTTTPAGRASSRASPRRRARAARSSAPCRRSRRATTSRPTLTSRVLRHRAARRRVRPALGRADLRRRRRRPVGTARQPRLRSSTTPRACARAGAATSSSRASTSCRSRTAWTSSSRPSAPTTPSSAWSATCRRICALRVEAYRKDYAQLRPRYENLFDPLSLVPELRWDRVAIAPDSARAEGIEWLLTRRGAGPWNGWLNYTWSRVNDREDGVDTRRSWDQTHSVGGGVAWASGPWQATLAAAWHTGWPTTPVEVVDADRPGRELVPRPPQLTALRRLRVARRAREPRLHAVTRRADGVRRSHQPHESPQPVLRRLLLRVPGRAAWCSSATTGTGCRWCRRSACSGSSDEFADRARGVVYGCGVGLQRQVTRSQGRRSPSLRLGARRPCRATPWPRVTCRCNPTRTMRLTLLERPDASVAGSATGFDDNS